ncbi:MAG: hypothetical protein LBM63_05080 [Rikenellaceae bacterium]|jgi:hypothetical protein|nr:hypothetical protein [Rikenellaceae bacterium]
MKHDPEIDETPWHEDEEQPQEVYTIGFDDPEVTPPPKSPHQILRELKEARHREEKAHRAEEKARRLEEKARRAQARREAVHSVVSGSFLANERVRRALPVLGVVAVVVLLFMATMFHLQRLHRTQQRLGREIHELSVRAMDLAAERASQTQRSAIVRQLESKNIPLREYPNPLKTIE